MYVKIDENELKKIIIDVMSECGLCYPGDIMKEVERKLGGRVDPRLFRRILADMVSKGIVKKKVVDNRFLFTI